jgi:hypothetical protein
MATTQVPAWPRWLFRAAITCETVLAFAQAALAGGFLAGHYDFLRLHNENGTWTGIAGLLLIGCAVVQWRPGRGPSWPIFASCALFVAEAGQIFLGYARILAVHVPLGVAITVVVVGLLVWAWREPRQVVA